MAGITLGRGNWEFRTYTLTTSSNLSQGTLVSLAGARTVSEYSGGQAGFLGVLTHPSANSLPAGQVVVAIPNHNCTAFVDVPTGVVASNLSLGQTWGLYKSGGVTSFLTTGYTSSASQIATVVDAINSATSRVEVTFVIAAHQYDSTVSVNIQ